MPTPIHQQIMDAVKDRLESIDGTGSYNTDLSESVYEWSPVLEQINLPSAVYRDMAEDPVEYEHSAHAHFLKVEVSLAASNGASTLSDLRKMIADVYRAVGTDQTWAPLAILTDWNSFVMNYEEENKKVASALVTFSIKYRTQEFNPDA